MSVIATLWIVGAMGLLVLAPYALYPVLVRMVSRREGPAPGPGDDGRIPFVSVLIPACNEAAHIAAKLTNTLALDHPPDRLEVLVCDDGSDDDTAALVASFEDGRVRLVRNLHRLGKAATLNRLADEAEGEVLLLTDASAELAPDALGILLDALRDGRFGAAFARYVVRGHEQLEEHGEAAYWDGETRIRAVEAERDLLIGASGAAYAIRAELMPRISADTINDDWVIPLEVRSAGHRIAWCPDARVMDDPTGDLAILFRRWQRIAYGNWQMLWRYRGLFFRGGRLIAPLSRKALKTLGAPLLLAMGIVLGVGALWNDILAPAPILGGAGLALGGLAVLVPDRGLGRSRAVRLARLGIVAQTAYLLGMLRFFVGSRRGLWARPGGDGSRALRAPAQPPLSVRCVKRSIDVTAAILALLLLWPFMLLIAACIKLDSKGPVFYRQTRLRCDEDGRPIEFAMLKFRSMCQDAEKVSGPVWAQKNDARVTAIGRVLRKHRLDELPQFVNVLRGEMSLIGPRPERPLIVTQLEERYPGYGDRHLVQRPGITGWAQVQQGYDSSIESVGPKLAHDLVYIAHLYRLTTYLEMEARVVWKTFRVLFTGKGAQ